MPEMLEDFLGRELEPLSKKKTFSSKTLQSPQERGKADPNNECSVF